MRSLTFPRATCDRGEQPQCRKLEGHVTSLYPRRNSCKGTTKGHDHLCWGILLKSGLSSLSPLLGTNLLGSGQAWRSRVALQSPDNLFWDSGPGGLAVLCCCIGYETPQGLAPGLFPALCQGFCTSPCSIALGCGSWYPSATTHL